MVYIMTLYSTVLEIGMFSNAAFFTLKGIWLEFFIIFLCAHFISTHVAKYFAFRVVKPDDRPIAIAFAIQTFMVVFPVALASISVSGTAMTLPANLFPITVILPKFSVMLENLHLVDAVAEGTEIVLILIGGYQPGRSLIPEIAANLRPGEGLR